MSEYKYPIELTNLKCKAHPTAKVDGDPSWFPIEDGKWVFDPSDLKCTECVGERTEALREGRPYDYQTLFMYTVTTNQHPTEGRPMVADIDEEKFA